MNVWIGACLILWIGLCTFVVANDRAFTTGNDEWVGAIVGLIFGIGTAGAAWMIGAVIYG